MVSITGPKSKRSLAKGSFLCGYKIANFFHDVKQKKHRRSLGHDLPQREGLCFFCLVRGQCCVFYGPGRSLPYVILDELRGSLSGV